MNVEIPMELAEIALIALKFCDSEMDFDGYHEPYEQLKKIITNTKKTEQRCKRLT